LKLSKKLISVIFIGIISLIFISGLIGIYSQNIDITSQNTETNVVATGSMEPTLYRGDIVIVEKNPDKVNVGDIAVYNAVWFDQPVLHRVIAIKKSSDGDVMYETKGDNNPVSDPYLVKRNQIISKVKMGKNGLAIIPKIGYITLRIRGL
jgi:signal peptidase